MKTDIEMIDAQHHEILMLAEKIKRISDHGTAKELQKLDALFGLVMEETLAHFEFEESLMEGAHYEYLRVHKRLHDQFIARMTGYMVKIESGKPVGRDAADYVIGWVKNHFAYEDKDYIPSIKEALKGSSPVAMEKTGWLGKLVGRGKEKHGT